MITPSSGWLVVRQDKPKDKTESGILIPQAAQEKALTTRIPYTTVVDPGDTGFEIGDRVYTWSTQENTVPVVLDPAKAQVVGNTVIPDLYLVKASAIAGFLRGVAEAVDA